MQKLLNDEESKKRKILEMSRYAYCADWLLCPVKFSVYFLYLCSLYHCVEYIWCVPKLGNISRSPMRKKFFFQRWVRKKYEVA